VAFLNMRQRKVVVCAPPASLSNVTECHFNWNLCCICQQSGGPLICPADNPVEKLRNQGYASLATNLSQLISFDFKLPCGKNVQDLDQCDGIEATFIQQRAKWHKACSVNYGGTRFQNLIDGLRKAETAKKAKLECDNNTQSLPDKEGDRRATRSSATSIGMKDYKCFLCFGPETRRHPLTLCATKEITDRVKVCATALHEMNIIGMLETGGDLVAKEAKYHKNCLVQLYNRHRQITHVPNFEKENKMFCEKLAFAELVLYIENQLAANIQCVFDMADIYKTFHSRVADLLNVAMGDVTGEHKTRLREKLQNYFPNLTSEKWGNRYVLKSRTTNLMPNMLREDQDDDAIAFHRFAKAVRKSISEQKIIFEGEFPENCEEKCIPGPLLAAVNTILYGTSQLPRSGTKSPVITISQLIMLNFHESLPKGNIVRHKKNREPPLPLYMGLSSYGRGRDKALTDLMHQKGMSVSSNRITEVTSQLCRLVVQRAFDEGVVCPSNLKQKLFTVTALDNIDVQSTSNTSAIEFHGTGISIFQCPIENNEGEKRQFCTSFKDVKRNGDRSVPNLPDFYTNVPDTVLTNEKPLPSDFHSDPDILDMIASGNFTFVNPCTCNTKSCKTIAIFKF